MVQTHPKKKILAKWYPRYLIGRAKAFDTLVANHNQGGNFIFAVHFPLGLQTGLFYRGQVFVKSE